MGTDGRGGRRYGGGWTAYAEAPRRRPAPLGGDLRRPAGGARPAPRGHPHRPAHDRARRGPRDNDKFIHAFKGANVDRAVARRKRDAERRLDEAERTQVRKPPAPLRLATGLTGAGSGTAGGRVVSVRDLVVGDRLRLPALDVESGAHLLVTGANGTGKSTLLGVLSGRITPTAGTVQVGAHRIAELTQDPAFPDLTATARATYDAAVGPDLAARRPLRSLGLLHPREHPKPVVLLSVGQRRRLALAIAVATEPDLLLLDEPTNHLSLALVGELEEAIGTSPGTVVVASHDRWLRRRWEGTTLRLDG
ncbi:ATP-binding cassette domain-containing protein [Pimelobacter simplex]|uniref:ATP-binding cassette domain-containing protein n=1 Tax=Nocardioides simplex TaxID=2045 RepID=UPI001C209554|nr:ATP-binding cassette domain-containing protein [Pimelobacter simplex]